MSEIKRLIRDSVPHFNKKSNEEQYKAYKAIKDAVEDAQIALERNDVEKIKQALDKGMELLQERQKLIYWLINHSTGGRRSSNTSTVISQTTKKMRKRYTGPNPEQLGPRSVSHLARPGNEVMLHRLQQLRSFPPHSYPICFRV